MYEEFLKAARIKFKLILSVFIGILMYCLTFFIFHQNYLKKHRIPLQEVQILGFHMLYVMLGWSGISTIRSDPGRVPLFWAFNITDDLQERRYCLICHIFKPFRCHHCSTCQTCVLNLDHHCPWINNCIGFRNKKLFILMIFYLLLVIISAAIQLSFSLIQIWQKELTTKEDYLVILQFIFWLIMLLVIIQFANFHRWLLVNNLTTIEHMQIIQLREVKRYDYGFMKNLEQVFGRNYWLWLLPINGPVIDFPVNGLEWPAPVRQEERNEGENIGDSSGNISEVQMTNKGIQNSQESKFLLSGINEISKNSYNGRHPYTIHQDQFQSDSDDDYPQISYSQIL